MSQDETSFCNWVAAYLGPERFSCFLRRDDPALLYRLRVHRLGDAESMDKFFTVFDDQLSKALESKKLPDGLLRELGSQYGR